MLANLTSFPSYKRHFCPDLHIRNSITVMFGIVQKVKKYNPPYNTENGSLTKVLDILKPNPPLVTLMDTDDQRFRYDIVSEECIPVGQNLIKSYCFLLLHC